MTRNLLTTLAVLTLAVTLAGCSKKDEAVAPTTTAAAPALPSDVAQLGTAVNPSTATTGTLAAAETAGDTLSATGEFVSLTRSELSAKIVGRVAQMFVAEGSHVTKGQPVLALETDYLRINLQQAAANAARAKAAMDEAARDIERKKELIAKGSIPQATFDRSQGAYDQARAGWQAATAQVSLLRQQLSDSTVRSPINGVVAEKRTEVGQRLGDGNVAVVVVQLSPLKLRFTVPERYLGRIGPGDKVVARVDPYPDQSFEGTIKTVGGVIDPATRTLFAEAEFPNRDGRLRPGLFARVEAKLN